MHTYYSVSGFHNCIESCQPCPARMGLCKQGKSPLFRKCCLHIIYFNKRILPLILDTFSSFFLFIDYLNLFIIVHITFSFCNPNINGQNFCEDINSKIDYFLSLGMEEK